MYLVVFIGIENALGIWISTLRSLPPNSRTSTLVPASSVKRLASTQPAEPAPMMM
ncbi:hypothetical protein D3C80_1974910 [compost metagenome]